MQEEWMMWVCQYIPLKWVCFAHYYTSSASLDKKMLDTAMHAVNML